MALADVYARRSKQRQRSVTGAIALTNTLNVQKAADSRLHPGRVLPKNGSAIRDFGAGTYTRHNSHSARALGVEPMPTDKLSGFALTVVNSWGSRKIKGIVIRK